MGTLLNRRRYMGGGSSLPYDAEIEYLQTDGNSWIDLGFRATDNISFDIYVNRANNNVRFDCGSEEGWSAKIIRLLVQEGNHNTFYQYGNSSVSNGTITSSRNLVGDFRIEVAKNVAKITHNSGNIYTKTMTGNTPILTPGNFILFNFSIGTTVTPDSANNGAIIYSAKVIDTNVNLDLIPVRIGQVGYLYDKNSKRLFGNAGTGDFVLGPDKN